MIAAVQSRYDTFLGMTVVIASEPMRALMELVARVARSNASVLIAGESGCGKEMVARAIHYHSSRSQKPWVDISCAALPEHLLESELFGYEKGAFSGADASKPGLFELANHGTIFLDEIGELDPRMQVKLLRVLDGVPYYRLGGVKKVSTDVRVVAATNQDLEKSVEEGTFRSDLFHRLNQFTLHVPPLRGRAEDIEPLARYFLAFHDPNLRFSKRAIAALEAHSWPGNVRELRNTVTRAALMAQSGEIQPEDLPFGAPGAVPAPAPGRLLNARPAAEAMNLDWMERRMILEALQATGGHQQRAADRLGISRRTLSRKLKIYGAAEAMASL
jgi:transcriptional regulator with PAS, ATPase and Fis domain